MPWVRRGIEGSQSPSRRRRTAPRTHRLCVCHQTARWRNPRDSIVRMCGWFFCASNGWSKYNDSQRFALDCLVWLECVVAVIVVVAVDFAVRFLFQYLFLVEFCWVELTTMNITIEKKNEFRTYILVTIANERHHRRHLRWCSTRRRRKIFQN